jgi:hypothetical protein
MSRASVLMATLTDEPLSTSELYDRIGYPTLTRLGLIPYHAFHAELERLAATGTVLAETARDGSTLWRRAPAEPDPDARTLS